jgi:ABC-type multidrug transport system ATPase subunit
MKISLTDAGKRFNREWIFRHFTCNFESGQSYAITGPNGSGKSTLLQTLSGGMLLNEGVLQYSGDEKKYDDDEVYKYVSICAPYLELIEEMTLSEFLSFHKGFKPFIPGITSENIIAVMALEKAANKQIRYFSSGMKQRIKLAQAIFSDVPVILLDEPCTNLDVAGIDLYHNLIEGHCKQRIVIVSSNDEVEYRFCANRIDIMNYKGQATIV